MDAKKGINGFVSDTPTSAFTRYVRPRPSASEETKDIIARRKSAFARIKQLFSLQSYDTKST
jgi:hypothetical protein